MINPPLANAVGGFYAGDRVSVSDTRWATGGKRSKKIALAASQGDGVVQ
ncbi:MAG: hypothetical protein RBU29_09100 [bacterium]|nr:hypothetical protein [bacterium]